MPKGGDSNRKYQTKLFKTPKKPDVFHPSQTQNAEKNRAEFTAQQTRSFFKPTPPAEMTTVLGLVTLLHHFSVA